MTTRATTPAASRRPGYAGMVRYADADRPAAPINLSDNTNRWGMPPAAARALQGASLETVTRYPDAYARPLKEALASHLGVDPAMVATGCGSDDVIDAAFRALADPGRAVAIPDPSFAVIPAFARANGLAPVLVPLTPEYDVDAPAMLAADAAVVYVCRPNNPTGTTVSRTALELLADRPDGILIVDEAYAEYADDDALDLAMSRPNVLLVRTLSKAFGLAGLRVGYGVGAQALVDEVEKARGPFKVNALGAAAAAAALRSDVPWVRERVGRARRNRVRLLAALRDRGVDAPESHANFVFAPLAGAGRIAEAMRARGVAVRPFTGLRPVTPSLAASGGDALRISVGPWAQVEKALRALDAARIACA